ncbi:MAG: phage tail tape measure protein [Alphaproteobacteria bacterium]|nr:MAG: phage tail tape measure protein [Alphaproteobacteria bacterium]
MNDAEKGLESDWSDLESALGGASGLAATFGAELERLRGELLYTGREVNSLSRSIGAGLRRAFDGVVFDGARLSDALADVARTMTSAAYSVAMKPIQNALGGAIANGINGLASAVLPFRDGAPFTQGRVVPFASGGIVRAPTLFPMRGATGLMGEAGPEAIMPLQRGPDGRLGVRAEGGGRAISVVMNITASDAESFRRSRSQIAAEIGRAIERGQRNR